VKKNTHYDRLDGLSVDKKNRLKPMQENEKINTVAESFAANIALAWHGNLSFNALLEAAGALDNDACKPLVAVLYQTWLARNQSVYAHAANFNLGVTLSNLSDLSGAEAAYNRAIAAAPNFLHPRLNLGLLHERRGQLDAALAQWQWVVDNHPGDAASRSQVVIALNHLGRVQEGRKEFQTALAHLTQSLLLEPDQPDAIHHWIFLRQKQCLWPVFQAFAGVSIKDQRRSTSALAMIGLSDDLQAQLTAAKNFVEKKVTPHLVPLAKPSYDGHKKIRIAYCSSDFSLHPVSMLTVEMYELHDRENFEVYGFCWSPQDGSALRQRVIASMDHFISIHALSDEAAAQLIASHEIDILVDLQGQTAGARANLLAYRPAPIQITYLGMPATTGMPAIDYVIADKFLIPPEAVPFYTEKPLYMPGVYQVSDSKRVAATTPTRASCGLPEKGFVFCSFNNSFKYTPEVFSAWMRILEKVPGSVLWLLADNRWAEENLLREAEKLGIEGARLIFARRVSPENYLARYGVADLFLDSFPFNAGTTANDCLWMGCLLITLSGHSFASRMAGALLTAAKLPQLITYTLKDYEAGAVALANQPETCAALKKKLHAARSHGPLFNTKKFVEELESQLKKLVKKIIKH
jgi:predicted O-linked N-acetylglucosamine transferase (SPINDLY family)